MMVLPRDYNSEGSDDGTAIDSLAAGLEHCPNSTLCSHSH